jgi:hypothetical protein
MLDFTFRHNPHVEPPTYTEPDTLSSDPAKVLYCPTCGDWRAYPIVLWLTIEDVLQVLPFQSKGHLYTFLWRHKTHLKTPRYLYGDYGRKYRVLDAQEVRWISKRMRWSMRGLTKLYSRLGVLPPMLDVV